jgi:hypothetical protein
MTVWNYPEQTKTTAGGTVISGIELLKSAADEADRQVKVVSGEFIIEFIRTVVINEPKAMKSQGRTLLSQKQVSKWNKQILKDIRSIGKFIRRFLITQRLSASHNDLKAEERALDMMFITGNSKARVDVSTQRVAKLTQLFLDKYCSEDDDNVDGFLFRLHKCLCITQINGTLRLTAQQAAQQQLEICHKHHYLNLDDKGQNGTCDLNPLNVTFRNRDANMAQKSCSKYFYYRQCQCPKVYIESDGGACNPRCHVLTREFYEQEVQVELVSIGGLFPTAKEVEIRSNIRDAFIQHCERHEYTEHDYLSDNNKAELLLPLYPHYETLRKRFDINAPGQGMYDERQGENVTFDSMFNPTIPASERKHLPKGFLNDLQKQLRRLTMPIEPDVSTERADTSKLLRSGIDKERANDLNQKAYQRMKMMPKAIGKLLNGDLTTKRKGMTHEEKLGGAFVSDSLTLTDSDAQVLKYNGAACTMPRLMKTIRDFIDHSEHWKENPNDAYPSVQKYLNHIAVKSAGQLSQVLAAAQEFEASHTNHLRSTRANRDLNPQHMWLENKHRNQAHGICGLLPEIPCSGNCQCHSILHYKCDKCFFKLDDEYVFDRAVLESQLGLFGQYGIKSYFEARTLFVKELKAVFESADKDVPDFLLFMEEHPELNLCVPCEECEVEYPSIRECEECCPAVEEVEEPRMVSSEELEDSDELMKEVLSAMLLHGVNSPCWTSKVLEELSSSTTPSFSTEPMNLLSFLFPASSRKPFHVFCARLGIVVGSGENCLVRCEGARSGCPCKLHDIELV